MRINCIVVICFLLSLLFVECVRKDTHLDYTYIATRCDKSIIIDGVLDESVWERAETLTLKTNKTGKSVEDEAIKTWTKSCHDGQNLYIAFECNDPDIWSNYTERDESLWKQEVVEVFIDTDNNPDTYIEIEVSPYNVLFDSYIEKPANIDIAQTAEFNLSGIQTAVQIEGTLNNKADIDKKWTVEIAVPFRELMGNSEKLNFEETQWKINYYRINRDRNDQSSWYAWSPTVSNFHVPRKFGLLKFGK